MYSPRGHCNHDGADDECGCNRRAAGATTRGCSVVAPIQQNQVHSRGLRLLPRAAECSSQFASQIPFFVHPRISCSILQNFVV